MNNKNFYAFGSVYYSLDEIMLYVKNNNNVSVPILLEKIFLFIS